MAGLSQTSIPQASDPQTLDNFFARAASFGARLLRRYDTPQGGVALLIATTLLARLLFADWLGLGIDESYMVAAGRVAHLGYFDHPPIAWWMAWAATHVLGTEADLAVRLPFILLFAVSTWLMYRLAACLFNPCAGLWAAVLMNAVPVLGITAGSWVLPDGPLIAALLGFAVCLMHALRDDTRPWTWWLGAGACFGIAMCSKYTASLTGAGAALYLLTQQQARHWLKRPQPYAAAGVALVLFAPVIAWNADHGWISMVFQGSRVAGHKWYPFGPLVTLAGEAFFFLPWIWVPLAICLAAAVRRGRSDPRSWLLVCLALPPIVFFEAVSLHAHVMYHWAAPGLMLALPLLGDAVGRLRPTSRPLRVALVFTAFVIPLGALLVATEVRFNWLPDVIEDFTIGNDPDLAAVDWTTLSGELARRGELHAGTVVAAVRWNDAGKIDYALHGQVPVICLCVDAREYELAAPAGAHEGADVLIVAPKDTIVSMSVRFGTSFDRIDVLPPVMLRHAGKPAMWLPLFRGHRLHNQRVARQGSASF